MSHLALERVSLEYPIYEQLRLFGRPAQAKPSSYLALNDVSLRIDSGERVALLGKNGAGKTTTLRVMAGIFYPTRGAVSRAGRVSALLSSGIGMNPDATGHENVTTAATILGVDRKSIIERILPDVEEFTELGQFMAMPLRTYSTGMRTRLSFAVSTAIQPEVLLMDEIIGAGDAFFVDKARARIGRILDRSSIVVLASHNLAIVRGLCTRGVVLEHGRVGFSGEINAAIEYYEKSGATR